MPVYFIRAGEDGPVKIGTAKNVGRRLRALQTARPERLSVVREIHGTRLTEGWLHRFYASLNIGGEWFKWSPCMASINPPAESAIAAHTPLLRAVEIAGGQRALAAAVGTTQQSVCKWVHQRGTPTAEFVLPIERATGVSRHDLRPDLYPHDKPSIESSTGGRTA